MKPYISICEEFLEDESNEELLNECTALPSQTPRIYRHENAIDSIFPHIKLIRDYCRNLKILMVKKKEISDMDNILERMPLPNSTLVLLGLLIGFRLVKTTAEVRQALSDARSK